MQLHSKYRDDVHERTYLHHLQTILYLHLVQSRAFRLHTDKNNIGPKTDLWGTPQGATYLQ